MGKSIVPRILFLSDYCKKKPPPLEAVFDIEKTTY